MKPSDEIGKLLVEIFPKRKRDIALRLAKYNIHTVEQLYGVLNPYLQNLDEKTISRKCLSNKYKQIRKSSHSKKGKILRLGKLTKLNSSQASQLYAALQKVKYVHRSQSNSESALSLGCKSRGGREKTNFWSLLKKNRNLPSNYSIPHYQKMGQVFNQGQRGTCVANAICSLIDYNSYSNWSRQFIYHQCKMVDGFINVEGTYLNVGMSILCDGSLIDYGTVSEKEWMYNPYCGTSVHQGPPPGNCYNSKRLIMNDAIYVRKSTIINDIKQLLIGSTIHAPTPVIVGLDIFESFDNYHSNSTGWITMPLPGEQSIGGHAMLVVGWCDVDKLFIVRNSWGIGWASNNPKGHPGHALIPYNYFKEYCHQAVTSTKYKTCRVDVPLEDRLYNTKISVPIYSKIAARRRTNHNSKKKKKSLFSRIFR